MSTPVAFVRHFYVYRTLLRQFYSYRTLPPPFSRSPLPLPQSRAVHYISSANLKPLFHSSRSISFFAPNDNHSTNCKLPLCLDILASHSLKCGYLSCLLYYLHA
ncbi:hypothetical protein KFK09_028185 [Dendrobium nobile]|uniref:Uncharacterized protein n=1 Tax=Dendrobium nobile TaxID=94219 RepID=A0A8T3A208_DENNO|nr:hypothetical protein KFK09_028185 [Dendrobium nobile]